MDGALPLPVSRRFAALPPSGPETLVVLVFIPDARELAVVAEALSRPRLPLIGGS